MRILLGVLAVAAATTHAARGDGAPPEPPAAAPSASAEPTPAPPPVTPAPTEPPVATPPPTPSPAPAPTQRPAVIFTPTPRPPIVFVPPPPPPPPPDPTTERLRARSVGFIAGGAVAVTVGGSALIAFIPTIVLVSNPPTFDEATHLAAVISLSVGGALSLAAGIPLLVYGIHIAPPARGNTNGARSVTLAPSIQLNLAPGGLSLSGTF